MPSWWGNSGAPTGNPFTPKDQTTGNWTQPFTNIFGAHVPRGERSFTGGPKSASDPFGQGSFETAPSARAAQIAYGGREAGSQLYNVGQGIDPSTGKPFSADDPNTNAGRYYSEAKSPIESGFHQQSGQVANYLARQGLGSSGINVGASQQLANNKEALEGQAKLKSIDMAQASSTQGILNNLTSQLMSNQPQMAMYMQQQQIQAQMAQLQAQLDAQSSSALGSGLGQLGGLGLGYLMFA